MKRIFALLIAASGFASAPVHAAGCLKGAVLGGVAGSVLGHHAVLGAVGGCLVGKHLEKKKKEEKDAARQK